MVKNKRQAQSLNEQGTFSKNCLKVRNEQNLIVRTFRNEMIPVESGELGMQVNSRLLHQALKSGWQYADWIKLRIEQCEYEEGKDFLLQESLKQKGRGGSNRVDYIITVDCSKELAMMENNKIGHVIRRYFIETEKQYRDWIGFWLPKLEQEIEIFSSRLGYNYGQLLIALGTNPSKQAFRSRISRNRQEFWKNQSGVWYVSEELGKNIILYSLARKHSANIRGRNLEYRQQKSLM